MEDNPDLKPLLALKEWAIQNGAILDSINFPVYYPEIKTVGITANKDISPYESFIYIPSKIILDSLKIERVDLKEFYLRNPELIEESYEISMTSLSIFIIFEILKGEDSFYYPFLRLISSTDLPIVWNTSELNELQDEYFINDILDDRIEINSFYKLLIKAMKKEAQLGFFKKEDDEKVSIELFINVLSFCQTRNFYATELQSIIVPIADFFNHFETDADFQIYDGSNYVTKHMLEPNTDKYYTMNKINHLLYFTSTFKDELNHNFIKQINQVAEEQFLSQQLENLSTKELDTTFLNDEDSFDENCNNDVILKMAKNIVKKKKPKKEAENDEYYLNENDEHVIIYNDQLVLKENDYFFISSGQKQIYHKGEQIFINYGQYSNEYLIFCYGFCYENNSHNKTKIRLRFPKMEEDERFFRYLKYILPRNFTDDCSHYIIKFNLIHNAVSMDLIKYSTFRYFYEKNELEKLFSYIYDKEVEIVVISKILEILEEYKAKSLRKSTIEFDERLLKEEKNKNQPDIRMLFSLIYRIANKKMVTRQISLLKLVKRIIEEGVDIGMTKVYEDLEDQETFELNRLIFKDFMKFRTVKV